MIALYDIIIIIILITFIFYIRYINVSNIKENENKCIDKMELMKTKLLIG